MMNELTIRDIEFAGIRTYQSWMDLWILNKALNYHKPELIIEIGTALGGTALFFSNYAKVHTWDINRSMTKTNDNITFHHEDVFNSSNLEMLLWDHRKKFLFCDGGNKIKEFNTFAKQLEVGDYVFVHDWNAEIGQYDIDITGFKYVLKKECEQLGSYIRGFEKI